jgi:hypothetical protein
MSELDLLRRLGDQIVPPPFEALRETARRRARRTRATSIAVAASVVAASATTAYLGRDVDRKPEPAPVSPPTSRPLTYADGSTIHYGDRTVEADGRVVELDLTDYGVAFRTDDGRIWFSDGSTPDPLGDLGTTGPGYGDGKWPLMTRPGWMLSANAGSRLVWFEFPAPDEPEVVVYDTASRQEVARDPVGLQPGHTVMPTLVSDRFVYWVKDADPQAFPGELKQFRYDAQSGEQAPVSEAELLEDLDADASVRSVRLKGDDRAEAAPGFHYSDGMGLQMGLDLTKDVAGVDGVAPVGPGDQKAEDVNRHPFVFEPPPDYTANAGVGWLVQWLDDETVVVLSPLPQRTDLITCHLETRRCDVAVSTPPGIVAPDFGSSGYIGG